MRSLPKLASTLQQVGLAEKEAAVYLALLSIETATAYQIAQHCDVKKPTVYVILEDLRKKGLVLKVPHAKKALFAARNISEYLQEQENKIKAVREIVPKLYALGNANRSGVYFFNGLRGIQQAIDYKFDSMRGKTFYSFYSTAVADNKEVMRLYAMWDRKALKSGISFRVVVPREKGRYYRELSELAREYERIEIRTLSEHGFPPTTSIEIANDFVRIIDEEKEEATIIDNVQVANAMRQIFEIVWEKGV